MATASIGFADKPRIWLRLMGFKSIASWETTCHSSSRPMSSQNGSQCRLLRKTRLEEALSRPDEPPAGGRNAPASGNGSLGDDPAGGRSAPASGSHEQEAVVDNTSGGDEEGLVPELTSSDDGGEPDPRPDLRTEAISPRHLLIHQPKDRYCKACIRCKMQRTPCKRGASSKYGPKPEKFGDKCICDYIIAYDELSKGIHGEEEAFVLVDIATGWMFGYVSRQIQIGPGCDRLSH